MQRRPFGRTGISVPALSFGASPLGGVFGNVTQSEADAAVRAAIDLGIDLFDTAPFYGLGRSETVLGSALRGIPRERFLISTKVGRYGEREFDFSAARVRSSLDESLGRLGVSHVDLLVCHDIEFGNPEQVVGETLPAMRDLVVAGKVRAIGVSGYPLGIFDWVLARFDLDFVLTYCHGTLQDRRLLGRLPDWESRGIGVVNASPLGMGLLSDSGPPSWHPAPRVVQEVCASAREWCASRGVSLAQLALGWSVSLPGVSTTLVGMSDAGQVHANAESAGRSMGAMDLPNGRQTLGLATSDAGQVGANAAAGRSMGAMGLPNGRHASGLATSSECFGNEPTNVGEESGSRSWPADADHITEVEALLAPVRDLGWVSGNWGNETGNPN